MIEELLASPLFIIVCITIVVFIIGMIIASSAHRRFMELAEQYSDTSTSLGLNTAEFLYRSIEMLGQEKTKLAMAGEKVADCYDYINDTIILKEEHLQSYSITSLAIASHELGHSMQRHANSFWLLLGFIFQKLNKFFQGLFLPLILIGLVVWLIPFEFSMVGEVLIYVGLGALAVSVLLKIVLIPLEFNASKRAINFLKKHIPLDRQEIAVVKKLLNAAGNTYIASLFEKPYIIYRALFK